VVVISSFFTIDSFHRYGGSIWLPGASWCCEVVFGQHADLAKPFVSRFIPRVGLVIPRQTFVRRCRLLPRAGFAARRQTFVRRGQNCGVGLRSSGGWQMRRATALRPAAQQSL
jgi:hypothetical protein